MAVCFHAVILSLVDRNGWIFKNKSLFFDLIWDMMVFMATHWSSAHRVFQGISLMDMQRYWTALL